MTDQSQRMQDLTPDQQRQRGRSYLTWVLLLLAFFAVIAGATLILIIIGMLPTIVAFIIDRSKGKTASICVGSINFIGVFPYILSLWSQFDQLDSAMAMVGDIFTLLVMYSAAAFGWLLFLTLPSIISSFVIVLQQRKVAQLRGEQKDLIEEWGEDVAAIVEMQKLEAQEQHMEHGMEGMHEVDLEPRF
ncbi:MAG: transposase family protein [Magnetovibrio sp.]|nr:transposase family protein [Magnetovibrio sp.]